MAIKIGGTTIVTDSRGVSNITSGVIVGINSDGTYVGAGRTTLNFVGSAVSVRAVDSSRIDVIVSSNSLNTDPTKNTLVGSGVTHLNFVGAAASMVGLTTAVVTISKTLTIGRRGVAAETISVVGTNLQLGRRDGTTSNVPA